jgi:hypothetical protein
MYGKRHPLSGATYRAREDGSVSVVARDGTSGVFSADGLWIEGELRCADPHMCGWVGGPRIPGPAAPRSSRHEADAAKSEGSP